MKSYHLFALLLAFIAYSAYAQPLFSIDHFLNPPKSHNSIETSYYLSKSKKTDKINKHLNEKDKLDQYPIGKTKTIYCHIVNNAPTSFNFTGIIGSLNQHSNYALYVQNYTYTPYNIILKPKEEMTLRYEADISKELIAQKYILSYILFYHPSDTSATTQVVYSTTFYNKTVELYDVENEEYEVNNTLSVLGGLFSILAIIAVTIYVCIPELFEKAVKKTIVKDDASKSKKSSNGWVSVYTCVSCFYVSSKDALIFGLISSYFRLIFAFRMTMMTIALLPVLLLPAVRTRILIMIKRKEKLSRH